jgi:hypothetical protein
MMRIATICVTALFATLALSSATALAGETVYRWVDKDGVVHFGNRPEGHADAEIVDVETKPAATSPEASTEQPSVDETIPQPTHAQKLRDERAQGRKAAAEEKREMEVLCKNNRERVATLEPVTRVMYEQEDGSVVRMDDNDRLEKLAESKAFLAENCDK